MTTLDPAIKQTVEQFVSLISSRYAIDSVILYGSRARETHHQYSDVDLAILLKGKKERFIPIVLEMADIAIDVMLETGFLVEALPIWLEEWENPENYSNPDLLKNIDKEGIRL